MHSLSRLQMLKLVGNNASHRYAVSPRPTKIPPETDVATRISGCSKDATETHMRKYPRQHLPQVESIDSGISNYKSFSVSTPAEIASTTGNGIYQSSVSVNAG